MEQNPISAGAWARACQARFGARVAMRRSPPYPLARMVEMPEGHAFPHGALTFRLDDLAITGLGEARIAPAAGPEHDMIMSWDRLVLAGRYLLEAKPDPVMELDSGGDLMELPPGAQRPGHGGANEPDFALDSQKEEWLDQARGQREQLRATANGQKLLGVYGEHNDTFEEVFRVNGTLPPLWKAGGATRDMAADTSTAIDQNGVINQPDKTYIGDVTYNSNALAQQLNVAAACLYTDPDFDPETGPPAGSKYLEAAKAALSFGSTVATTTGNTKQSVNPMTPDAVHGTVQAHDGELDPVSDDDIAGALMESGLGGRDGLSRIGGVIIDEEDRERLRGLYEGTMRQRAEDATIVGRALYQGPCTAIIEGVRAQLRFVDGAARVTVSLPAFALEFDDGDWQGEVARVARRRLESMHFIRSLLHGTLTDGLTAAITAMAQDA